MPLPAETNPRFVFERLFGSGDTRRRARGAQPGRPQHSRRRDAGDLAAFGAEARRARRRQARASISTPFATSSSASPRASPFNSDFALPERPAGVPRHVQGTRRADVRSAGAGVPGRHHARQFVSDGARKRQSLVCARSACPRRTIRCRTTATTRRRWRDFSKLNTYHVETLAYFLKKLQAIPDGDGTLLDQPLCSTAAA